MALRHLLRFRLIVVVLFLTCSWLAAGCSEGGTRKGSASEPPYFGDWEGTDRMGQPMQLHFHLRDDGATSIYVTLGPSSAEKRLYGTCNIDLSKTPASFDIQLDDRDTITTILELVDPDTLQFENINSNTPRPTEFGDDVVVLTRKP